MTRNPVMLTDGFHDWFELDPGDVLVIRLEPAPVDVTPAVMLASDDLRTAER